MFSLCTFATVADFSMLRHFFMQAAILCIGQIGARERDSAGDLRETVDVLLANGVGQNERIEGAL
jgi:hypothetical protein